MQYYTTTQTLSDYKIESDKKVHRFSPPPKQWAEQYCDRWEDFYHRHAENIIVDSKK